MDNGDIRASASELASIVTIFVVIALTIFAALSVSNASRKGSWPGNSPIRDRLLGGGRGVRALASVRRGLGGRFG